MAGLPYYDYFFKEFPYRPLHVDSLGQLRGEWILVLQPKYRKELKHKFLQFHPPGYAEKHYQTWLHALDTACLDPDFLEEYFKKTRSVRKLAEWWSALHGPPLEDELDYSCKTWLGKLIFILRHQDRLCLAATHNHGPKTLMVEIIEDEVAEYDEREYSNAAYGSIGARLKILDEYPWDKVVDEDQPLEVLAPWEAHSRLPTPYLYPDEMLPLILSEPQTCYFGSGLWYYNAFFEDFPSRAIVANSRAEIDEEWNKVQDPNYRSVLRRIFNNFHVGWTPEHRRTLMADKHLTTWIKTLEYAYSFPEELGGYNDHSVRTGYLVKVEGNIESSVAPPDNLHELKTYLLQVPDPEQEIYFRNWQPPIGIWVGLNVLSDLEVSREHYIESLHAISTNSDGKAHVMSGSTYGLSYYDQFFIEFPKRALPVQRPPAGAKSMLTALGAPLSQDWNHISDSLRQEYNKIGNPHYRYLILNKFRQFHNKVAAKRHLWTWIKTLTRVYHDSTRAQNFIEANWAFSPKWDVNIKNGIEDNYWIWVKGKQTTRGRDVFGIAPEDRELNQFYRYKWQMPSPQSWRATEDTVKQIQKLPFATLQKTVVVNSETDQKNSISRAKAYQPNTTTPEAVVKGWKRPENDDIDLSVGLTPLTLLDLPVSIRAKILNFVLISKKPIRPRRCDRAIGTNFEPVVNEYCPCRVCRGTKMAQWDIRCKVSTYAVAATCRMLREQSIPIYYAHNRFQFYVGNQNTQALVKMLQSFFRIIGRQTARYIQHIIWEDVNDPNAFEDVLVLHAMKEFSGVKTIEFLRLPTQTVECRQVLPARQKETTPALSAMERFLTPRFLLRNLCTNMDIVFPTVPAMDPQNLNMHDIENCKQCQRHKAFFHDIDIWFHRMKVSRKPLKFRLFRKKDPKWRKIDDAVSREKSTEQHALGSEETFDMVEARLCEPLKRKKKKVKDDEELEEDEVGDYVRWRWLQAQREEEGT